MAKCLRILAATALAFSAAGCVEPNEEFCRSHDDCEEPTPFCDVDGKHEASGFLANLCIPTPSPNPGDNPDGGPDGPPSDAPLPDGELDAPPCANGASRPCYSGPDNTEGVGQCTAGTQTCSDGTWGPCEGETLPAKHDVCGDGIDQDCDRQARPCICKLEEERDCYDGSPIDWSDPPVTFSEASACKAGKQTCVPGGDGEPRWGACQGDQGPAGEEGCEEDDLGNGIDENCDGEVDETCLSCVPRTFYRDSDGDRVGVASDTKEACKAPAGYAAVVGDCDDSKDAILPGRTSPCGQCGRKTCKTDNSGTWTACTGDTNSVESCGTCGERQCQADGNWGTCVEDKRTYYPDGDGDTYGSDTAVQLCFVQATNHASRPGDCDDANASIIPGATSSCGQCGQRTCKIDNSGTWTACAGVTASTGCGRCGVMSCQSDGTWGTCVENETTYYVDGDGDTFGAGIGVPLCPQDVQPRHVTKNGDCDDDNDKAFPGQTEYFEAARADGSHDYNCDDTSEKEFEICPGADIGFRYSDPACGNSDTYGFCASSYGEYAKTQKCR